ncbi:MAG: alpha/beta hydrolase [Gammaproteobacteria bacterium]
MGRMFFPSSFIDSARENRLLFNLSVLITVGLSVGGCATAYKQAQDEPVPDSVDVQIFFATDRGVEDASDPAKYFGGSRGEMTYGIGTVAIKTKKSMTGHSTPSVWDRSDFNASKSTELVDVDVMTLEELLRTITVRTNTSSDKSAIVYTHGYARKFEQAAGVLASVVYKINFQGIPVLYSWPSKGSATAYAGDLNDVEWTVPQFRDFLKQLAKQHDLDTIHLAAHSLGNRAFLRALIQLLDETELTTDWKFGEIILMAPDVDRDIFERDFAPVLAQTPSRVTLYVSSVDIPLRISRSVNLYSRVGDASDQPFIYPGFDTIDASDVAGVTSGHSYYRETPEVLEDLYYLIIERLGADDRPTLDPVYTEHGRYWKIKN